MLKSKSFTSGIIVLILFFEISTTLTALKTHNLFYSVINPIFWVVLVIFVSILTKGLYIKNKFKKDILQYTLITVLIYIILYLLIGLFVGFGKNPYATNLYGILSNLLTFGVVIIAKEYLRYKLINNVYEKDKIKVATFISILYVIIDFNFYNFFTTSYSAYYIYKEFAQRLLPSIIKNILFSYTAMKSDYMPSILYELTIKIYFLCSPILSKTPWILNSIIDILIPFVLYLFIRYMLYKKDIFKAKSKIVEFNPREIITVVVIVVIAVLFTVGLFPIKPIAVLTGSMTPGIAVGDVVIVKKCSPKQISVGDIIEYQLDGFSIIHRVIEIKEVNNELCFVTKGDNNKAPDSELVKESQVIGKSLCSIKYLGYPAVWIYSLQNED